MDRPASVLAWPGPIADDPLAWLALAALALASLALAIRAARMLTARRRQVTLWQLPLEELWQRLHTDVQREIAQLGRAESQPPADGRVDGTLPVHGWRGWLYALHHGLPAGTLTALREAWSAYADDPRDQDHRPIRLRHVLIGLLHHAQDGPTAVHHTLHDLAVITGDTPDTPERAMRSLALDLLQEVAGWLHRLPPEDHGHEDRQAEQEPTPPALPTPRDPHPAHLEIVSDPPGLVILLNGAHTGWITPCTLPVEPEEAITIAVVPANSTTHSEASTTLVLGRDEARTVELIPTPIPPLVALHSWPPGLRVVVDGVRLEECTPCQVELRPDHTHLVQAEPNDPTLHLTATREVRLAAGERASIDLVPRLRMAHVVVRSTLGSFPLLIDGRDSGYVTPTDAIPIPSNTDVVLEVVTADEERWSNARRAVHVPPGAHHVINLDPFQRTGTLEVRVEPMGHEPPPLNVSLDGARQLGSAPVRAQVLAGRHVVTIEHHRLIADVRAGETTLLVYHRPRPLDGDFERLVRRILDKPHLRDNAVALFNDDLASFAKQYIQLVALARDCVQKHRGRMQPSYLVEWNGLIGTRTPWNLLATCEARDMILQLAEVGDDWRHALRRSEWTTGPEGSALMDAWREVMDFGGSENDPGARQALALRAHLCTHALVPYIRLSQLLREALPVEYPAIGQWAEQEAHKRSLEHHPALALNIAELLGYHYEHVYLYQRNSSELAFLRDNLRTQDVDATCLPLATMPTAAVRPGLIVRVYQPILTGSLLGLQAKRANLAVLPEGIGVT